MFVQTLSNMPASNVFILTDIKTLYIDDLCVDERKRGRHIGKTLYDAVIAFAKEQECYNVTLNVWSLNENAMKFYQSCGMIPQKIGMETLLKSTYFINFLFTSKIKRIIL